MEDGLWVILLEAGFALSLLLLIVWSTWPKGKPDAAQTDVASNGANNVTSKDKVE
jgi:hypothetical protein